MEDQRRYWTEKGKDKTFTTPFQMELFAGYVPKGAHILDFGCGYGRTMVELKAAGYSKLTGIDFSETLIQRAWAKDPALDLVVHRDGPLPFEDRSFDAVVMLGVFTCLTSTKQQAETLIEIKRVLKPGGYLYVNDFLLNRDKRNLDRYAIGKEKYGIYGIFDVDDGGVMRHHDRNHMEALFFDFETIAFEEVVYDTMHGNESKGFYALLRLP